MRKNFTSLPEKLVIDLQNALPKKSDQNHALSFIDNLMKKSWRDNKIVNSFVEIPAKYLLKIHNGNYNKWLKILISNNIIICNNYYSIYNKTCLSYSINTNYFYNPAIMFTHFKENPVKTVLFSSKNRDCDEECLDIKNEVIADFKKLDIDYSVLLQIMEDAAEKMQFQIFKINEQINRDTVQVIFKKGLIEKKYWMTKSDAIRQANEQKSFLIEDEDRYYIMDKFEFIMMKRTAIYSSYRCAILNMEKGNYFARRNSTNNRLDTNITNMSNALTDEICKRNDLVQFDLANSQFAIFSDIFQHELNTEDFLIFKEHSQDGTLYEYLMEYLDISDRKKAKNLLFQLLFSKETNNSPEKQELKKIFPSVVAAVDNYKITNGYKNFSILLQTRESEIFIDYIWKKIKSKKLFCLTKHDSFIVRRKDSEKIKKIIQSEFDKIKFFGKIVES